ncbi:MAG TPA: acyltransferase family protein [Nocardioidaceae bacterium]|nr:acyltransferase family protein [Nocardioidaceae bacterium]
MSTTLHAPTTSVVRTAPAQTTKQRDPWFDNAKMLLVTLVVLGHSWTLLPETALNTWVYNFLYLWHVPAFVMVTGYLSRSFTWKRTSMSRLLTTVALPYVVFEAALAAFRVGVGGEDLDLLFADPHWPMWYLSALFLWRLVTPVFKAAPAALALAVGVSLLGGLTTGDVLDVARAMGLLPFFVVGLLARPEHLALLRRPAARLAAGATMALAFALTFFVEGRMGTEWLYWRASYGELHATFLEGAGARIALLLLCGLVAVSFFALVPQRGGWFSRMGAATLVVYLFHGFVIKGVEYTNVPDWASAHPVLGLALVSPLAVVLALLLGWPPVATRLNVLVDPVGALRRLRARRAAPEQASS